MSGKNEKKYCVTIKIPEVDVMIVMNMDKEHYEIVTTAPIINWMFNNGCQITIDKNFLDNFSVELMQ